MLSCARPWGTPVGTESDFAQERDAAILEVAMLEVEVLEVAILETSLADTIDGLVVELEGLVAVAVDAPVVELSDGPANCVH